MVSQGKTSVSLRVQSLLSLTPNDCFRNHFQTNITHIFLISDQNGVLADHVDGEEILFEPDSNEEPLQKDVLGKSYATLKNYALGLLARREHAINELQKKLEKKGGQPREIQQILAELIDANYLNEQRYVEMMLRSRFSKGHGPMRFKQEVRQHKVADDLVQQALEAFEGDWFELAFEVREKRFGAWLGGDYKDRAKQMRFLASRGFSPDQIEEAFSSRD